MHRAEVWTALGLVVGAGILVREALRLPISWTSTGPGAGFFPFWLAAGAAVCSILILIKSARRANRGPSEPLVPPGAWRPLLIVFLPMVAIVLLMGSLGMYLGGALYLGGYMWFVGRHRPAQVVLVSVLVPLGLFLIFERWFLLPMPKGPLLEYLLYGR
jgi:hypothetical protein